MLYVRIEKQLPNFHLQVSFRTTQSTVALFGPSGAGKSLTLQCIAGLMRPDRGEIRVGDRLLFDCGRGVNLPARERRVGYLFQSYALFPHLTVRQNVGFGLHRLSRKERAARVEEALETVRLSGLGERKPSKLSGGEQQRVALARALVTRPELLLLDEPFAALDALLREELRRELLLLLREVQVPTLLVTHDLNEAYALSREMAVFDGGRVLQIGPREEVYHRPGSCRVAELVGFRNLLPGTVTGRSGGYVRVAGPGFTLWSSQGGFSAGQQVTCCIRPEEVQLVEEGDKTAGDPGHARIACTLADAVDHGSFVTLLLRPASQRGDARLIQAVCPHAIWSRNAARREKQWIALVEAEHVHLLPAQPDQPCAIGSSPIHRSSTGSEAS